MEGGARWRWRRHAAALEAASERRWRRGPHSGSGAGDNGSRPMAWGGGAAQVGDNEEQGERGRMGGGDMIWCWISNIGIRGSPNLPENGQEFRVVSTRMKRTQAAAQSRLVGRHNLMLGRLLGSKIHYSSLSLYLKKEKRIAFWSFTTEESPAPASPKSKP